MSKRHIEKHIASTESNLAVIREEMPSFEAMKSVRDIFPAEARRDNEIAVRLSS